MTTTARISALESQVAALNARLTERQLPEGPFKTALILCSRQFSVSVADILGQRRFENVKWARFTAMHLLRSCCHLTLEDIGSQFGRHHGLVLHACRRVKDRASICGFFAHMLCDLESDMRNKFSTSTTTFHRHD